MLKGSLDEFTLSDVFRLLSFTKKTGRLEVVRGAGDGRVFFRDGEVYFAQSSIRKEPLGQKLVRMGALTEAALMRALDLNAETGQRVGEVLLSEGSITEQHLIAGVREQIEDAVFDLLRWEVGDFEFESHERFIVEIPISVSVENLIMEASRRLDELQMMQMKIPSPEVVLAVAPTPPEGAREINITPDEWRLLVLVDGARTVGEICETAQLDEFTGFRTLYGLISSGLVDVASLGPSDEPSPVARPPLDPDSTPPMPPPIDQTVVAGAEPTDVPVAGDDPYASHLDFGPVEAEPTLARVESETALDPLSGPIEVPDDALTVVEDFDTVPEDPPAPDDSPPPGPPEDQDTFLSDILGGEPANDSKFPDPGSVPAAADNSGGGEEASPARVDRAAVVRELAGLFNEEGSQPRRQRAPGALSDAADEDPSAQPSKRRIEDDDEINKGLIGRFIDGVKGM